MGLKYKKNKKWGTRYLHVALNVTQNGFSSVGFKVGPISWNTRTKAFRFDGPGGIYWQQNKAGNRRERRTAGDRKSTGRGRKRRGAVGAVTEWGVTWVARGARWSAVQAGQRTSGYADAVSAPGSAALQRRRRFGRGTPVVADLTSMQEYRAADAPLADPEYGDRAVSAAAETAWKDQVERDAAAWRRHALRERPLSALERWQMRRRGEDPDAWEAQSRAIDAALAADRALRRAAEQEAVREAAASAAATAQTGVTGAVRPAPTVAAHPGGRNTKEHTMANPVHSLADLRDPAIDPDEYQHELPDHIGQAARVVGSIAELHRQNADALRQEAEAVRAYAEYMESAEVDRSVLAPILDAAEQLDGAATSAAAMAEHWESAESSLQGAHRAAEAFYGEHKPPKFRKAG